MNRAGQWLGLVASEKDGHVGAARLDIDQTTHGFQRYVTISSHSGEWCCVFELPSDLEAPENSYAVLKSWQGWEPDDKIEYLYIEEKNGIFLKARISNDLFDINLAADDHTVSHSFEEPGIDIEWSEFKSIVLGLERYTHIFRGQGGRWPLRTSFHRKSRWSIHRYFEETLPSVRRELEIFLDRKYGLDTEEEQLNFCSLLQHHGFPTPILDWTYSPFIAAFFSLQRSPMQDIAQVFVLDKKVFESQRCKFDILGDHAFVRLGDFAMVPNKRHLPQQSISMATNIDHVGGYFRYIENNIGKKIYNVYNLSSIDREKILSELAAMGITAATMFPGLDGICEALRGKLFGDYSGMENKRLDEV